MSGCKLVDGMLDVRTRKKRKSLGPPPKHFSIFGHAHSINSLSFHVSQSQVPKNEHKKVVPTCLMLSTFHFSCRGQDECSVIFWQHFWSTHPVSYRHTRRLMGEKFHARKHWWHNMEYCDVNPRPIDAPTSPSPLPNGGWTYPSLSPLQVIVESKIVFHDWRSLPKTAGKR